MHSHHHHERWILLHVPSLPELRGREEDMARKSCCQKPREKKPKNKNKMMEIGGFFSVFLVGLLTTHPVSGRLVMVGSPVRI
jgi:hypothetical protein